MADAPSYYTEDQARHALVAACRQFGSQKAFAEHYDVSVVCVNEAVRGRIKVSPKVAKALGLNKITVYVPDQENPL